MIESNRVCTITDRQASLILAGVIFCCFFSFLAGYFVGRRQEMVAIIKEGYDDAFADQIAASLYALDTPQEKVISFELPLEKEEVPFIAKSEVSLTPKKMYRAQLIGFSTHKAALDCAQAWKKKGFEIDVKKREGKTVHGKATAWYQLVTKKYENKEDLEKMVAVLKKQEKLKDVHIISC